MRDHGAIRACFLVARTEHPADRGLIAQHFKKVRGYASRSGAWNARGLKPARIVGANPVTRTKKTSETPAAPRQKRALRGTSSKARRVFFWSKRCQAASGNAPQQWRSSSRTDCVVSRPDSDRKCSQCQISPYHSWYHAARSGLGTRRLAVRNTTVHSHMSHRIFGSACTTLLLSARCFLLWRQPGQQRITSHSAGQRVFALP